MPPLLFGTAGAPTGSATNTTLDGVKRVSDLGLGCMEVEFVMGVRLKSREAALIAQVAANRGIRLSVHAPYFINFNARESEKVRMSEIRLLQSARAAAQLGAKDVAFHAAFAMGDPPEKVYESVKRSVSCVLEDMTKEGLQVRLRPELMGKSSQFGALNEVLRLSSELPGVQPCIDFAHWHARTGAFNSYPEFSTVLSQIRERLGDAAIKDMHIHVAGIAYGKSGELKHLDLKDSDFAFRELLQALRDARAGGLVICESPNQEQDALLLQRAYTEMR